MELLKKYNVKMLVNHKLEKGHIGYKVIIKNNSILKAKGWKWDYIITLYTITQKKFIFKYEEITEFDCFIYRDKQLTGNLEFEIKEYNDLEKFIQNLNITEGDRPAGYFLVPSDY